MSFRELLVLVEYEGQYRRFFKFVVSSKDASVYLVPYSRLSTYYYGKEAFAAGEVEKTFNFKRHRETTKAPHVSIHQSGRVHVRAPDGGEAGPVWIPQLIQLKGHQVAVVSADDFSVLPIHAAQPSTTRTKHDHVTRVEGGVHSGRVSVFVNATEPRFPVEATIVTMTRPTLPGPLFVALAPLAQQPLGKTGRGLTVLCGADPFGDASVAGEILFVRGE